MSIRLRLTLWYAVMTFVTIGLCSIAVYGFVAYSLYRIEKQTLENLANAVFEQMDVSERTSLLFGTTVTLSLPELNDFRYSGCYLQVIDAKGQVRDATGEWEWPLPPEVTRQVPFTEATYREFTISGYSFLAYTVPIWLERSTTTDEDAYVGAVQVMGLLDDTAHSLSSLRTVLLLVGVVALAVATSIGWFLARKALSPIDAIISETQLIGQEERLRQRIEYQGPSDELGRLTQTINGMIERLQTTSEKLAESIEAQRRFVSDASHELRTPLTTILGNAEWLARWHQREEGAPSALADHSLVQEAIADIVSEARRMSRLVRDLLQLARSDAGQVMEMHSFAIVPVIEEAARQVAHMPHVCRWYSRIDGIAPDVRVYGNMDAVRQLVFIFIDNAFQYTDVSGEVELDLLIDESRERMGIRVRDTGIGIASEHLPRLFERFYRIDVSRGTRKGTGLGLAIAKRIIEEHCGAIDLYAREGIGTTIIAWLPLDKHHPIE